MLATIDMTVNRKCVGGGNEMINISAEAKKHTYFYQIVLRFLVREK